jgi:hypothetical protein
MQYNIIAGHLFGETADLTLINFKKIKAPAGDPGA